MPVLTTFAFKQSQIFICGANVLCVLHYLPTLDLILCLIGECPTDSWKKRETVCLLSDDSPLRASIRSHIVMRSRSALRSEQATANSHILFDSTVTKSLIWEQPSLQRGERAFSCLFAPPIGAYTLYSRRCMQALLRSRANAILIA